MRRGGSSTCLLAVATKAFTGGEALEKKLKEMSEALKTAGTLAVGFQDGKKYPDSDLLVAQVAFWNEFGEGRAPPRPFFRNMIKAKGPGWGPAIATLLTVKNYSAEQTLSQAGDAIVGQLELSIRDFNDPGNAPSTIARKGRDSPLIDSGLMSNSITKEVKE